MSNPRFEVLEQVDFESEVEASDYRNFLDSQVWRDLESVLLGQIGLAQEDVNTKDELRDIYRAQGRIEALRTVVALPGVILADLEDRKGVVSNG